MTKIKKFQEGALIDEETLFDDDNIKTGGEGAGTAGLLDGELAGGAGEGEGAAAGEDDEGDEGVELTGVEQFLTNYGVNGGIITYEDGTTAKFSELEAQEQATILSSLVSESVPTIEEKFNLDDDEINLLNAVRDSNLGSEEFINSIVDHRLQTVLANRDADSTDYKTLSEDAIFVKGLKDSNPDITEEEIAQELVKAKELSSYSSTVESMRKLFISEQTAKNEAAAAERDQVFNEELEAQRHTIVEAVEGIQDIAGAIVNDEMKEYLLHDIMELNDEKDPILMEKIFSDPKSMFEANWFLNYGKDYITQLNNYWKKEVSKAHKMGYEQATGRMAGNPTIIGENGQQIKNTSNEAGEEVTVSTRDFGTIVTEEELFDEKE